MDENLGSDTICEPLLNGGTEVIELQNATDQEINIPAGPGPIPVEIAYGVSGLETNDLTAKVSVLALNSTVHLEGSVDSQTHENVQPLAIEKTCEEKELVHPSGSGKSKILGKCRRIPPKSSASDGGQALKHKYSTKATARSAIASFQGKLSFREVKKMARLKHHNSQARSGLAVRKGRKSTLAGGTGSEPMASSDANSEPSGSTEINFVKIVEAVGFFFDNGKTTSSSSVATGERGVHK